MVTEHSLITDEMRQDVGVEWEPYVQEIDKRFIRKFAEAVGDSNPLWSDDAAAARGPNGSTIAPPTFYVALDPIYRTGTPERRWTVAGQNKSGANAFDEVEIFEPIRPGDTITARAKIADIYEREGRAGKLLFTVREVTYTNQHDRVVAISRGGLVSIF